MASSFYGYFLSKPQKDKEKGLHSEMSPRDTIVVFSC